MAFVDSAVICTWVGLFYRIIWDRHTLMCTFCKWTASWPHKLGESQCGLPGSALMIVGEPVWNISSQTPLLTSWVKNQGHVGKKSDFSLSFRGLWFLLKLESLYSNWWFWYSFCSYLQRAPQDALSNSTIRDFPGGPVVKNPPYNSGDIGSILGLGTKILHAVEQLSLCATTTEAHELWSHVMQLEGIYSLQWKICMMPQRSHVLQLRLNAAK